VSASRRARGRGADRHGERVPPSSALRTRTHPHTRTPAHAQTYSITFFLNQSKYAADPISIGTATTSGTS
jgi:hypothetical protein